MKNMERLWNEPLAHISSFLLRHRCTSTSSCHTYSKVLKKDHHLHMCVQHLYLANRAWQCPINTYERCEGPTKWSFTNCLRSQQDTNVFAQQFSTLFWHQHKWYRNQKASKDVLSPIELKGFGKYRLVTNFIPIKMVGWLETSQQKCLGNFSVLLFCQEFSERMRDSFICMTIAFQSVSDKRPL